MDWRILVFYPEPEASQKKDRVTRTPLKTGGELKCSGRVGSSCSTSDTRRVKPYVICIFISLVVFMV